LSERYSTDLASFLKQRCSWRLKRFYRGGRRKKGSVPTHLLVMVDF